MTDRHRQLGASTAAPEIAETCTECRGFANVPQMLRGRWARGVCHACGGAGTRTAQVGRALPWVGDDELGARVKAQSAAMAAAIAFDVSAGEVATHPPALDDADDHRADATRYAMCASGPLLGRDNWSSRRALWADVNEPPKPESPALLEQVREAMPRGDWGPRMDPRTAEDAKALVSPAPPFAGKPVRQALRCTVDSIVIE